MGIAWIVTRKISNQNMTTRFYQIDDIPYKVAFVGDGIKKFPTNHRIHFFFKYKLFRIIMRQRAMTAKLARSGEFLAIRAERGLLHYNHSDQLQCS